MLEVYHLYLIWLQGQGEADQKNLDAFESCLLDHSNYQDYWAGQAQVVEEGSYVVPPPTGALGDAKDIGPFIESLITSGKIPKLPADGKPVYEVLVDPSKTSCSLGNGTGGRNAVGTVQGAQAGLVIVTTNPASFWPARTPLGGETTLTQHEVAEVIDGLRGGDECCGDCCCEGWCGSPAGPSCGNLQGLTCPGAPATTATGSSACGSVKGWLIQTLSHQGATTCNCPITCDYQVKTACTGGGEVLLAPCTKTSDCCAGLTCQNWSFSGKAPYTTYCCKAAGDTCTQGTDCCGGLSCTGGKCTCVAAGQWCVNDGDCCAGLACDMTANKCVTAPPPTSDAGADGAASGSRDGGSDASGSGDSGGIAPEGPDATADDAGGNGASASGSGGGCGCVAAGGATPAPLLLFAALAGALFRRRGRGSASRRGRRA
jgi:hypothetical protein